MYDSTLVARHNPCNAGEFLPADPPLLAHDHVFAHIAVLSVAFEDTLRTLRLIDRNDPAVTIVAKHIIELAKSGERDRSLRDAALEIPFHIVA
jgi:hypothetical protein